jgi:CTP synthase
MSAANSVEFDRDARFPVIDLMPDQKGVMEKGGTMRLGAYPCVLDKGSIAAEAYGSTTISERHRHRYEVNTRYRNRLENAGLRFSGLSPDGLLPEIVERPDHPWFIAVQFHPELKSRPFEPHPLFASFIGAAVEQSRLV